ncbi:hypothetical protein BROUX41_001825 [Berkeleyomyces rouxiae]|uniref:uncharacterized protein n=1 Tax=Berkeleyomyces rouxiae TaxID=2035830 RepID=UPI003B7982A2
MHTIAISTALLLISARAQDVAAPQPSAAGSSTPSRSAPPAPAKHWWWNTDPSPSSSPDPDDELAQYACPSYSGCLCNPIVPRGRYCGGCSWNGTQVVVMTGFHASSSDMFYCDGAFCCWMRNETCSPWTAWCEWH